MKRHCTIPSLAVLLLAGGCAGLRAPPADDSGFEPALRPPERAALVRDAAGFSHPRLAAVELDFSRPLSPAELAVIAVLVNPELRALRAQQQVARAQSFAAGLLPDPQLSLGVDRPSSPPGLFDAVTRALTLDLGAVALRRSEQRVSLAAEEQLRLDVLWQEWLVAGQARSLGERVDHLARLVALARESRELAERALGKALEAAERRDLRADELQARQTAASDATDRLLGAERDFAAAKLDLNRILGLPPGEPLVVARAATVNDAEFDAAGLFAAARGARLDLQALQAGLDSQDAALHRAILGRFPRISLTLTRANDTSRVQTFGPAVTLDLPLWNRNRGVIREAEATRERLRAEFTARLYATRAEIASLASGLAITLKQRDQLLEQLPTLRKVAASYGRAAERGDVSRAVADGVRAVLLDKEMQLESAELQAAEQRIALELAVGRPLEGLTE